MVMAMRIAARPQTLSVELALRGNSLVLVHHSVAASPEK